MVSVVSIKGEGCKLESLNQVVKETNGNIDRVNPADILKNFSNALKDELVALEVLVRVRLHNSLCFKN